MRLNTALIVLSMAAMSAGCSPYLYKGGINEFSKGVNQLAEAYKMGLRNVNEDIVNRDRWIWLDKRPSNLELTEGCPRGDTDDIAKIKELEPCGLRNAGTVSTPFKDDSKPIVQALQEYADALAAVTNAADREALDKAQAELKQSLVGLIAVAATGQPVVAKAAGPVIDLINYVGRLILDNRRYQYLKMYVPQARKPVEVLGGSLGDMLTNLRNQQVVELRSTAMQLKKNLGPKLDEGTYAVRLDALQSTVTALEALRSADPQKAATDMVDAHNKLADALAEDRGQAEAVITATKTFLDKAKAVHEAFTAATATTQKGSQ